MSSNDPPVFGGSQSGWVVEPGVFHGATVDECEEFIANVRTYAKTKGKARDNNWIADEVYDSFRGKALRWYMKQPVEVRRDWDSLQQAMLDEWSRDELTPSPPAAAPAPLTTSTMSTPRQLNSTMVYNSTAQMDGVRRARVKTDVEIFRGFGFGTEACKLGEIVEVLDSSGPSCQIKTARGTIGRLSPIYLEFL